MGICSILRIEWTLPRCITPSRTPYIILQSVYISICYLQLFKIMDSFNHEVICPTEYAIARHFWSNVLLDIWWTVIVFNLICDNAIWWSVLLISTWLGIEGNKQFLMTCALWTFTVIVLCTSTSLILKPEYNFLINGVSELLRIQSTLYPTAF